MMIVNEMISFGLKGMEDKGNGNLKSRIKSLENYYEAPNICEYCGSVLLIYPNQKVSEVRKKKFCNRSCAASYNNKERGSKTANLLTETSDSNFTNAVVKSTSLNEVIRNLGIASPQQSHRDIVSTKIKSMGLSLKNKEIVFATKGELFSDRLNWQSARSSIQKMARTTYQNSNKPKKCMNCGYDKHYEICHILSVSSFSPESLISEINSIDNLIALCPNCHWEYDNGLLTIDKHCGR